MPWIKLDDHFDEHPKFAHCGPLGMALWIAGLAYCNRNLTDGFIPWSTARNMVSWEWLDEVGITRIYIGGADRVHEDGAVSSDYVISLLVGAGLWKEERGGFRVHDYEKFQPSRAQVEAEREAKRAAGQAGGQASAQARAQAKRKQNASRPPTDSQAKSNPVPVPVPENKEDSSSPLPPNAFEAYERLTLRYPTGNAAKWLSRLIDDHGEAHVERALIDAHAKDSDPMKLLGATDGLLSERAYRSEKEAEARAKSRAIEEQRERQAAFDAMTPEEQAAARARFDEVRKALPGVGKEMA